MSTNFKTVLRRFEVAISSTILIIVCQQFSSVEQHKQDIINRSPTEILFNFQHHQ
jgi:hypothetical protein